MANPGLPNPEPPPGAPIPGDLPPLPPDDVPDIGPTGPGGPDLPQGPEIDDPGGPGSEPDYLPGGPTNPGIRI